MKNIIESHRSIFGSPEFSQVSSDHLNDPAAIFFIFLFSCRNLRISEFSLRDPPKDAVKQKKKEDPGRSPWPWHPRDPPVRSVEPRWDETDPDVEVHLRHVLHLYLCRLSFQKSIFFIWWILMASLKKSMESIWIIWIICSELMKFLCNCSNSSGFFH